MTKLVNRAKMTTATTGTGTITLGSAVDGYQTFADAGVANADVVRYVIEDGDAWEIGLGTYSSGTLTRGSIESSNADNALNLTGNAVVFVSAAAADLQELVDFADNFVLPTADGSTGQVLTTNGAGTLSFSTITGYSNADVDTHLNTGTAASGEVLSWNGTDYDWVTVAAGATNINGLSDASTVASNSLSLGTTRNAGSSVFLIGGNSSSDRSVFIGDLAGEASTTDRNMAIGYSSGRNITGNETAYYNIAIGYSALGFTVVGRTGENNIGIGQNVGSNLSTGSNNTLIGRVAGQAITTGSNNVAIGNGALDAATTGGRNIAIGQDAMGLGVATTASGDNIAIGYRAGYDLTSGVDNVTIGEFAGANLTTGSRNIAIGDSSLSAAATSNENIAVGSFSLTGVTTGFNNVAIGRLAGAGVTTGTENLILGFGSAYTGGVILTTGSNNILLGNNSAPSSATVSNEITLGNSSITTLRCQVTTITSLSDARDKTDIQPLNAGLEFVEALNPVSFNWNMRDGGKVGEADTGFIAQDLQAAQADTGVSIPGLVYDVNPDKLEAGYGKLIPVLVQAIKDLSEKVKDLEAKLEAQN